MAITLICLIVLKSRRSKIMKTYIVKTYMLLCSSCFCKISALCVSWITYDHLYCTPYLAYWALFGSLVPAICNRTSCAQVHELLQTHCGDNRVNGGHIVFMITYNIYTIYTGTSENSRWQWELIVIYYSHMFLYIKFSLRVLNNLLFLYILYYI